MCNFLSKHCATMLFCNMLALNRHCALELHLKLHNMKQQPKWAKVRNMSNRIFCFSSYFPWFSSPPANIPTIKTLQMYLINYNIHLTICYWKCNEPCLRSKRCNKVHFNALVISTFLLVGSWGKGRQTAERRDCGSFRWQLHELVWWLRAHQVVNLLVNVVTPVSDAVWMICATLSGITTAAAAEKTCYLTVTRWIDLIYN